MGEGITELVFEKSLIVFSIKIWSNWLCCFVNAYIFLDSVQNVVINCQWPETL